MPQPSMRIPGLVLPTLLTVLLGTSVLPAPSARAEDARAENAGEENAGAERAQPAATSAEADSYRVEISAGSSYKVGATGSVTVALTAKAGFHINDQYPYRFRTSPPAEGVSYPKPVLERGDGQFAEKTAVFSVPFVASRAGQFAVGGVLSLSVCSPASCIVQKAPLDVSVTVQ